MHALCYSLFADAIYGLNGFRANYLLMGRRSKKSLLKKIFAIFEKKHKLTTAHVRCMSHTFHQCMQICMHACRGACVHARLGVCMQGCMHAYKVACMRAALYAWIHGCMHACMHACRGMHGRECVKEIFTLCKFCFASVFESDALMRNHNKK